jgi:hypothetical protein
VLKKSDDLAVEKLSPEHIEIPVHFGYVALEVVVPHAAGAAPRGVRFFRHHDIRAGLLCTDGGHQASDTAADTQDVTCQFFLLHGFLPIRLAIPLKQKMGPFHKGKIRFPPGLTPSVIHFVTFSHWIVPKTAGDFGLKPNTFWDTA